jgi:hypothetical protein
MKEILLEEDAVVMKVVAPSTQFKVSQEKKMKNQKLEDAKILIIALGIPEKETTSNAVSEEKIIYFALQRRGFKWVDKIKAWAYQPENRQYAFKFEQRTPVVQ